jgi:GDP-L-fucose synthase
VRNLSANIFVAGHNGMVGSAIIRHLKNLGYKNIITAHRDHLDLSRQIEVENFFAKESIDQIYLAAAKVGGIFANSSYPANFIYENLLIESNIIHSAFKNNIDKLLFLGSSCIYPKDAKQPMNEEQLLTGVLESTNEPYAIAKIAGIKLCESYNRQHNLNYRSVMPTNLYGPMDNYHPENSHVIPGLIRRFHEARLQKKSKVVIWGSGEPKREFLHVDDMANACVKVMELDNNTWQKNTKSMCSHLNVGSSEDISIRKLAELIAKVTNFKGKLEFDSEKQDGVMRKLLDNSRIEKIGWRSSIKLKEGLLSTYDDFKAGYGTIY